ncbi:MAG: hypothetical protein KDB79_07650, partial [Acidobacteria bacterium]|nr:hypothetical protein [Acidobacteriota bacterium]
MNKKKNNAEIADRHQQLITLALLFWALKYVASAAKVIVEGSTVFYLDLIEIVFVVLGLGIFITIIFSKFRNLSKAERRSYIDPDGYLFSIAKKAMSRSWAITFIVLAFLEPVTKHYLADLPPRFFIKAIIALLLGTFSITFFILDRKESSG